MRPGLLLHSSTVLLGLLLVARAPRAQEPVAAPGADDPANANADFSPKPPVRPLPPTEQATRFWLPEGYRMEPVLWDPDIEEPAQIAFDGNGRMFVVELRGYKQTLDGIDETPPTGRISAHEDRDNDGVYEQHSVFVDSLVFPRFVLPFGADRILTMESNADEVWLYTDTDKDGVADEKELFTTNFGRRGNIEHQPSSLFWAMDNWLYSTVNAFRVRWTPDGILREPTGSNGGQWGISQDSAGRLWFQGGASGMPSYFQSPIHYGTFRVDDQFEPDLNITWGAPILVGDIQEGLPNTRMPDGSLIRATAGAGSEIYRGDRLPSDLVGDYLYGEVVARIVRRLTPVEGGGLTQLRNAYPRSEFIRSLDPLFRPVDIATAPDGTLYIADMYRGIIEGAPWAKAGTYLRRKIEQHQLDKVDGHGRIWRLTYEGMARDETQPRMLDETPAQLVAHLAHPNGWWRDTAQQLLVLRQDTAVVPALQRMARTSRNLRARFHALWTLEGLGALDAELVRALMKDPHPQMRIQAVRASETLYKAGDHSLADDYRALTKDTDTEVVMQAMLTLHLFKVPDIETVIEATRAAHPARGVQLIGRQMLEPATMLTGGGRGDGTLTDAQRSALERGETIYNELCFTCHGADGRGVAGGASGRTMAPSLAGSTRVQGHRDYVIKPILHGMTGPIDGKTYADVMVPMGTNRDEWIADVASFIRNAFGNRASLVAPADVARVRAATRDRRQPWTIDELKASVPAALQPNATWKVTASHNAEQASAGLTFAGWTSRAPQTAGMWFQVELPEPALITQIQFSSPPARDENGSSPPLPTFPRRYRVQLSMDGRTWETAVADRNGQGPATLITFAPTRARFVRIMQTATPEGAPEWSIERLRLYEAPR